MDIKEDSQSIYLMKKLGKSIKEIKIYISKNSKDQMFQHLLETVHFIIIQHKI